jgi:UDP-glucuronate 4-epimerase
LLALPSSPSASVSPSTATASPVPAAPAAPAAPTAPTASADSSFAYVQPHLSFSNETVLLTGGAGFIGSHTAQRLLERGNKVIVIDNFNDYYDVKQKEANIDHLHRVVQQRQRQCIATVDDDDDKYPLVVVRGSICDRQVLAELFDTHQPTLVIHLAARAGVRPSLEDPQLYVDTNVMGTTNLLEISRVNHVKHFVYASSSSVYGGSMKSEFSETDVVDHPVSPYAATKKATELLASTYHHLYQLNTSGLRFFTVYGPRGRPDMAPYKFLKRASQGTPIDQYGDGTSERDYTYVDDIVDGILRTMDRPSGCQVYNLGNGVPITLKKFISLVKEVASDKHELKINYMPNQPGDVNRTCANITKATTMLGYQTKTSFENGLRRTFEWFQTKK